MKPMMNPIVVIGNLLDTICLLVELQIAEGQEAEHLYFEANDEIYFIDIDDCISEYKAEAHEVLINANNGSALNILKHQLATCNKILALERNHFPLLKIAEKPNYDIYCDTEQFRIRNIQLYRRLKGVIQVGNAQLYGGRYWRENHERLVAEYYGNDYYHISIFISAAKKIKNILHPQSDNTSLYDEDEVLLQQPRHYSTKYTLQEKEGLYTRLVKSKIISTKTSADDFYYMLSGGDIPSNFKPIGWLKSAALLAYFIQKMFEDTDKSIWEISKHCFTIKGKPINKNSLKNARSKVLQKESNEPNGHENLDEIMKIQ